MMDTERDVREAMELLEKMDDEKRQVALAYLREMEKGAA